MMKHLTTFVAALMLLATACNSGATTEENTTPNNATSYDGEHCYLLTVAQEPVKVDGEVVQEMIDKTELSLSISDTKVTGSYNYLPAETDSKTGTLDGTIDETGKISATYTFMQEGEMGTEEVSIQLAENQATIGDQLLEKLSCMALRYNGTYGAETESDFQSVTIQNVESATFSFEIVTGNMQGCTGEISGNISIAANGTGTYTGDNCEALNFAFADNSLQITETNCDALHGMQCGFSGAYVKE